MPVGVRNIMSALYLHAIRWEWATANPITSVRQRAKREAVPEVLTVDELVKLLSAIPELFRTAVSSELGVGESASALEDENDLQPSERLGVCKPCQEAYAALIGQTRSIAFTSSEQLTKLAYRSVSAGTRFVTPSARS
jgi:hypothetical protein